MDNSFPTSYEFLKENIYNKMKSKILVFPIKVDFNIISNFLLDANNFTIFLRKEINNNNNLFQISFQNKNYSTYNNNYINNDKNKQNDYNKFILLNNNGKESNDVFKVKSIYNNHCLNHSILIMRFIKVETSDNDLDKNSPKNEQILDNVISFYIDINDNSTVLINELYYNLSDRLFEKFIKIVHLFYEKTKKFVKDKVNKYFCHESILIPENMDKIFNYLYSCKIFHNDKFKITKIQKIEKHMEISCEIGSSFPVNACESKLVIDSISNYSSWVVILNCMDITDYTIQAKLLNIKSIISMFLKKLRRRIKNEDKKEKLNEKKNE